MLGYHFIRCIFADCTHKGLYKVHQSLPSHSRYRWFTSMFTVTTQLCQLSPASHHRYITTPLKLARLVCFSIWANKINQQSLTLLIILATLHINETHFSILTHYYSTRLTAHFQHFISLLNSKFEFNLKLARFKTTSNGNFNSPGWIIRFCSKLLAKKSIFQFLFPSSTVISYHKALPSRFTLPL
jgi:hypothetical protein